MKVQYKKCVGVCLGVCALVMLGNGSQAFAQDDWYAYGAVGFAHSSRKAQADSAIVGSGVTAFTSSADERDTAYKLQLGYRLTPNWALEGGYVNMGKFTYDAAATVPVATRHGHFKADGLNLAAVGRLPVADNFAVLARLGGVAYAGKYHCEGTGIACTDPDRTKHGIALNYGVGAEWQFASAWFMRFEYEVYNKVGSSFNSNGATGTSRADIRVGSVGIGHSF